LPLSLYDFVEWTQSSVENRLPLFVMAAAVHAAYYPDDIAVRYSGRHVITALVEREIQRLTPLSVSLGFPPHTLLRLLVVAILAGGLNEELLDQCWTLPGIIQPHIADPQGILDRSGLLQGGQLPALKPDMVAAIMVAECLQSDIAAVEWTQFALNVPPGLQAGCERIARIAQDEQIAFQDRPSSVVKAMLGVVDRSPETLISLSSYFGRLHTPLSLASVEEAVWTRLSESDMPQIRASALNNLSHSLLNRREYKLAAKVLQHASDIYRKSPGLFGDDTAYEQGLMLMNTGRVCCDCEQDDTAITILKDAIRCFQPYAERGHMRATACLSGSQDLLARSLLRSGKKGEALRLIMKATTSAKLLAEKDPDQFESE
jgi:hypothetical protein